MFSSQNQWRRLSHVIAAGLLISCSASPDSGIVRGPYMAVPSSPSSPTADTASECPKGPDGAAQLALYHGDVIPSVRDGWHETADKALRHHIERMLPALKDERLKVSFQQPYDDSASDPTSMHFQLRSRTDQWLGMVTITHYKGRGWIATRHEVCAAVTGAR